MKTFKTYLIAISLIIIFVSGCKKGNTPEPVQATDLTKPTITITKPIPGQLFVAGNTILFQATFSDNVKLKSYDIVISQKVLGGFELKVAPTSTPFSYSKLSTVLTGGKTQDMPLNDIIIPSNTVTNVVTTGTYNVKVTCVDSSDNSTSSILEININ